MTKGYQKADYRSPYMGLDNKVCECPAYWCRLHEIWLSEEDVLKKKCFCKPTFDMLGVRKCGNIERREVSNAQNN